MIKRGELYVVTGNGYINTSNSFKLSVYYVDKITGCLLNPDSISLYVITPNTINQISNNNFFASTVGDFGIIVTAKIMIDNVLSTLTTVFYGTIQSNLNEISFNRLLYILKQELPVAYTNSDSVDSGHFLDCFGTASVLTKCYNELYDITNNILTPSYNYNWEYLYLQTRNVLSQAVYPSSIIKLFSQIPAQTSITQFDLLVFLAKFAYYWTGLSIIVWLQDGEIYINYDLQDTWILGVDGYTELGETTILGGSSGLSFQYFISQLINKLFPVWVRCIINFVNDTLPPQLSFVGFTYRDNYNSDIIGYSYNGDQYYPSNILGYKLI